MFKFLIRTLMFAIKINSIKRIIPEGSIICGTIAPKKMNEKTPIFTKSTESSSKYLKKKKRSSVFPLVYIGKYIL